MTAPYYADDRVTVHHGRVEDVLPTLADASVDAVVCDPPYNLPGGFMGREWDNVGEGAAFQAWCQLWAAECLRILKPGGHLLAFGAPRTYHRLACGIEDAGFEIRDSIHWVGSQGFPKGQDIGKAIDRRRNDRDEVLEVTAWLAAARDAAGLSNRQVDDAFGFDGMARHWTTSGMTAAVPPPEHWEQLRELLGFGPEMNDMVQRLNARKGLLGESWEAREVVGSRHSGLAEGATSAFLSSTTGRNDDGTIPITVAASDDARRWEGWSTQLKPAHEPIVLARRPTGFDSTVANVLKYGTGALNIDGCRVATDEILSGSTVRDDIRGGRFGAGHDPNPGDIPAYQQSQLGRWPSNVVFSHSASCGEACAADFCPVAELDRQSGVRAGGSIPAKRAGLGYGGGARGTTGDRVTYNDGGASRYFPVFRYEAKAPASERPKVDGVAHETVKPLALIQFLVRLSTQPGGTVLDPFLGSGTTAEACVIEGFRCVGIERDARYLPLIKARLSKPMQAVLGFEEPA